jgi:nitrogen-specific signal transduction histidine kinase
MVKKIIDVSGGTISFESKPGNTIFMVTYPREGMKAIAADMK